MAWKPRDGSTRLESPEVKPCHPERSEGAPDSGSPPGDDAGLWIDTDNALGADRGNVDDGLAIAAILGSPARVLGISCVAGNTDAASVLAATRALLGRTPRARDLPLLSTGAAPAHLATLPDATSLLALGPLTNVAAAARLDPTLPARCTLRVVATLNAPWRSPLRALRDLNVRRDRAAARTVLVLPWRRLLVFPLDVVRTLRLGEDDLARMERDAGELGSWLSRGAERWRREQRWRQRGGRFRISDVVAALDAVGELPGARFAGGRLVAFDAPAARARLHELVTAAAAGIEGRAPP